MTQAEQYAAQGNYDRADVMRVAYASNLTIKPVATINSDPDTMLFSDMSYISWDGHGNPTTGMCDWDTFIGWMKDFQADME